MRENEDYYHCIKEIEQFRWFVKEFIGFEFNDLIRNSNYKTYLNSMYFWWLEKYIISEYLYL